MARGIGLRGRLFLVVAAALAPACALIVYRAAERRRSDAEAVSARAVSLARAVASVHDESIGRARQMLVALSSLPFVRDGDAAATSQVFAAVHRGDPLYANLGVIAPDGRLLVSALPYDPSEAPLDMSDRPYFRRAVATKAFAVGDFQVGRLTRRRTVNVALPLLDGAGTLTSVVFAALDLVALTDAGMRVPLPEGGSSLLLDPRGTVLVRHPDPEAWRGRDLGQHPLVRAILDRREGSFEHDGLDGVPRIYGFVRLAHGGAAGEPAVAAGLPSAAAYAASNRALVSDLWSLAAVAALALGAAWLVGDLFVRRRLRRLSGVAGALAAGRLDARAREKGGGGEIGLLEDAFDAMAAALERRRDEVERERRFFNEVFDAAGALVIVVDPSGRVVRCNPEAQRVLGRSMAELSGHAFAELVPDAGVARALDEDLRDVLAGRRVPPRESRLVTRDGAPRTIEWTHAALAGPDGATFGVRTGIDVTERRLLEQQVQQSQKMEAVGRLAGSIAHDFNNFLAVIQGYGNLLLEDPGLSPSQRDCAEQVARASERGIALTRQLLSFSRKDPFVPGLLDLSALVASAEKMLRMLVGTSLELDVVAPHGLGLVRADPAQMEQVLVNLVVNARDATPHGGRVRVETARASAKAGERPGVPEGDHVTLTVSDTGTGMTAEVRAHLFEPFFTTKPEGQGTGLGLSTVYAIAKRSGGEVTVESEVGRGTTVRLWLPRVPEGDVGHPPAT